MSRESAAGWAPRQMKGLKVGKSEWTTIKGKRRKPRTKPLSLDGQSEAELEDEVEVEVDDQEEDNEKLKEDLSHESRFQSSHPPLLPTPPLRQRGSKQSVVCRYYLQGFCRDGKKCLYVHALFPQPLKRSQTQPNSIGLPSTILYPRSVSDLQVDSEQSEGEDDGPLQEEQEQEQEQEQDPHLTERGTPPIYHSDSLEDKTTVYSSGRSTSSDTGSEGSNGPSEHSSHFAPTRPRMHATPSIPIPLPPGLASHSSPLMSSFSPESLGGLSGFSSNYSHILSEASPLKLHGEIDLATRSLTNTPKMSWTVSPRSAPPQRSLPTESPLLSVSAPGSFGSPTFLSLPPPKLPGTSESGWNAIEKDGISLASLEDLPSKKFEELEDDALHADLDLKLVELALCDGPESELLDQHPSMENVQESEMFSKEEQESGTRHSRSHSLQVSTTEFSFPTHSLSTSAPLSYPSSALARTPPPLSPPGSPRERTTKSKNESKQKSKSPRLDSSAKSKKVCPFFLQGICRYGTACHHRHQHVVSDQCLSCGNSVGITLKEQKQHLQLCTELTTLNKEKQLSVAKKCCLCSQFPVKLGRKFGLLISCNHPFCLQCIREYRGSSDRPSVRACPKCKVTSHYVIPCDRFVTDSSRKEKVITEYKKRLGQIDCKHFNKGKSTCPFGDACFYRHSTGETRNPLKKSQSHPPSLSTTPLTSPLLSSYSKVAPKQHHSSYSPLLKDRRPLLPLKKDTETDDVDDEEKRKEKKQQEKHSKTLKFMQKHKPKAASASSTPVFRPIPIPLGMRKEYRSSSPTGSSNKRGKKFVETTNGKSGGSKKI